MTVFASDEMRPAIWFLSQPLLWAALGAILGPYLFFHGFRALQMKRHIMNVPRCTIRAAALGPIEVSGKAVGPYTLVAPFSKTECLFYCVVRESDSLGPFSSTAQKICAPLYLDDGTGTLMVSPHALGMRLSPSFSGSVQLYPIRPEEPISALRMLQQDPMAAKDSTSVQEYVVKPGDPIFVLGSLQQNPWAEKEPNVEVSELSRIGPGFVSEDEAEVLRHEAFPFLDPALPGGEGPDPTREFDLHPLTILMRGKGPFLISGESQREVLAKLSWKSLLFIWGGPVATLWALWELLVNQSGIIGSPFTN
jgi:hypothetical protein